VVALGVLFKVEGVVYVAEAGLEGSSAMDALLAAACRDDGEVVKLQEPRQGKGLLD